MTDTLTLDQIRDAQANGLEGISAVLSAMDDRLTRLANAAAERMTQNHLSREDYRDDFRQDAALAMFEALPRFVGNSVDEFFGFMWSTIEARLKDKVREARHTGADDDAVKVFAAMLERADGDLFLAEKMAQTVPPKGRRLSADRAQAARMAWVGSVSFDAPVATVSVSGGGAGVGPDGLKHYSLADALASSLGVPEDLITAEDITAEQRREKHAVVHAILDTMGENQARALRHSYGINGATCYGTGADGDLEGLAAELGLTPIQARDARTKGHKAFAKRYIKAMARTEAEAAEMTEAAARNLGRGGRK